MIVQTYEQAFKLSTSFIKKYYKPFYDIEFSDYYQECALWFYKYLKKYPPEIALRITKKMYYRVFLYLCKNSRHYYSNRSIDFYKDLQRQLHVNPKISILKMDLDIILSPSEKQLWQLLADGYLLDELVTILPYTFNTLQHKFCIIRQKIALYYKIDKNKIHHRRYKIRNADKSKYNFSKRAKKVEQLDRNKNLIRIFNSAREAVRIYGKAVFHGVLDGRSYYNFYWRYLDGTS